MVADGSAGVSFAAQVAGQVDATLQAALASFGVGVTAVGVGTPFLRLDGQAVPPVGGSLGSNVPFSLQGSCSW